MGVSEFNQQKAHTQQHHNISMTQCPQEEEWKEGQKNLKNNKSYLSMTYMKYNFYISVTDRNVTFYIPVSGKTCIYH